MRRVVVVTLQLLTALSLAGLANVVGWTDKPVGGTAGMAAGILNWIFICSVAAAALCAVTACLVARSRVLGSVLNVVLGVSFVVAGLALVTVTPWGWFAVTMGLAWVVSGAPLLVAAR